MSVLVNSELRARIQTIIDSLPILSPEDLHGLYDDSCPICLQSFSVIFADPDPGAGVTKLDCNHIFCRKDLVQWIQSQHGSCPACRCIFIEMPSESDEESSDGGEYIPDENDEDFDDYDDDYDDDAFLDTDGFSDNTEYGIYDMTDDEESWEDDPVSEARDRTTMEEVNGTEWAATRDREWESSTPGNMSTMVVRAEDISQTNGVVKQADPTK